MSRNLADLKAECSSLNLIVIQSGKKEAKSDYESALREFYWQRDHAGALMAEQIEPMLARNLKDVEPELAKAMLADGSGWVAQEKINGCRLTVNIRNPNQGRINWCLSRNLSDETYRLNELHDQMPHYRDLYLGDEWEGTVVDGEVLMPVPVVDTGILGGKGVVTVDILQATAAVMNSGADKSVKLQEHFGKLALHAFDCLRFKGRDIRQLPYVVLTKDGQVDQTKESRYGYLMQVVARFIEVMGEMPCQHCLGITRVEEPEVLPTTTDGPELPEVFQDSFDDILNG